ncbi:hypothetical protein D3C74_504100 [compost metagenome]
MEFIFKIGHCPDTADDDLGILLPDIVDQQITETVYFYIRNVLGGLPEQIRPLFNGE